MHNRMKAHWHIWANYEKTGILVPNKLSPKTEKIREIRKILSYSYVLFPIHLANMNLFDKLFEYVPNLSFIVDQFKNHKNPRFMLLT